MGCTVPPALPSTHSDADPSHTFPGRVAPRPGHPLSSRVDPPCPHSSLWSLGRPVKGLSQWRGRRRRSERGLHVAVAGAGKAGRVGSWGSEETEAWGSHRKQGCLCRDAYELGGPSSRGGVWLLGHSDAPWMAIRWGVDAGPGHRETSSMSQRSHFPRGRSPSHPWLFLGSDIAVILRASSSPASAVHGSPEPHKGTEVHGVPGRKSFLQVTELGTLGA